MWIWKNKRKYISVGRIFMRKVTEAENGFQTSAVVTLILMGSEFIFS